MAQFPRAIQKSTIALVLRIVHAALEELRGLDTRVRREFDRLPEGMGYSISTGHRTPVLHVEWRQGRLRRLPTLAAPDCKLSIKTLRLSFQLFTGQMGVAQGYARHAFCVAGDVADVMKLVRLIDLVEAYLFPPLITRRILTDIPPLQASPLRLYARLLRGFLTGKYNMQEPQPEHPHPEQPQP